MGEIIPFNPLERLSIEQLLNRLELSMGDGEIRMLCSEIRSRNDPLSIIIIDGYLDDWEGTE